MLTRREIHGDNIFFDIGIPSGGGNDPAEEKEKGGVAAKGNTSPQD